MPKRGTREWLNGVARGLASAALALSVLSWGATAAPAAGARAALAEDIDCYNDKDLYGLPECVERRALDKKEGNSPSEAQGAPPESSGGQQSSGGGGQQTSGGGQQTSSGGGSQQSTTGGGQETGAGDEQAGEGGTQQSSGGGQQQASGGGDQQSGGGEEAEEKPKPRGPLTDPKQVVLTIADAGKEATPYISDEGSDKFGKFARTRYERDRSNGASALGPNVMDSKVWIAKDVETAKQLFKEQAAIKNFPERKEGVQGPVEKIKPTSYGEEFSFSSGFFQDEKVWQHWRMTMRVGNVVSVVYLFGREEFFQDEKDKTWTGQGDWFTSQVFHRM